MLMKLKLRAAMAVACVTLAMVSGTLRAEEIPLITGKQWTESSEQMKKAYLVGIANLAQVDIAFHAGAWRSSSPALSAART